jgi:hypothetical protein
MHYWGESRQQAQQVGNAVPYPVAVEVAGCVWEAATDQTFSGLPILKGPSREGMGLSAADRGRWVDLWQGLDVEGQHGVVLGWKEAMEYGGLKELKESKEVPKGDKRKQGQQGSRSGKRNRTSTPPAAAAAAAAAAATEGSAGAAAADSGAAGTSIEESASQQ